MNLHTTQVLKNRPVFNATLQIIFSALIVSIAGGVIVWYMTSRTIELQRVQQRNALVALVSLAQNAIQPVVDSYRQGEITREQAIDEMILTLRAMTFTYDNRQNYIFMTTYTGTVLVQPFEPQVEGTNRWDYVDPVGNYSIRNLVKTAQENPEGGFYTYSYYPPNSTQPETKISYVLGIPDFELYIGTGTYMLLAEKQTLHLTRQSGLITVGLVGLFALVPLISLRRINERQLALERVNEERKQTADALRRESESHQKTAQRAELLASIAKQINNRLDLDRILNSLCSATARAFNTPIVIFSLYDEERQEFHPAQAVGIDDDLKKQVFVTPSEDLIQFSRALDDDRLRIIEASEGAPQPLLAWLSKMNARTVLSAFVVHKEQRLGLLSLVFVDHRREFEPGEMSLLKAICDQASVAVFNARLYEEVKRTGEQLREVTKRMMELQETERRNLARELHDEIGQMLTYILLTIDRIDLAQLPATQEALQQIHDLTQELTNQVRGISLNLRPTALDNLGFLAALPGCFERYTQLTGKRVDFKYSQNGNQRFSSEIETTLYRTLQEALTNIARYSTCDTAAVYFWVNDHQVLLQIEDQGPGFDVAAALSSGATGGLVGMQKRAQLCDGQVSIDSRPGEATTITLELPLQEKG